MYIIFLRKEKNFIVLLFLIFEKLGNMCVAIIFIPVYDVTNFGINLSFLLKPFSYMTKKVGTKIQKS